MSLSVVFIRWSRSSLITSLLSKIIDPKKINTFTIGFDFDNYNEAPYAKKLLIF